MASALYSDQNSTAVVPATDVSHSHPSPTATRDMDVSGTISNEPVTEHKNDEKPVSNKSENSVRSVEAENMVYIKGIRLYTITATYCCPGKSQL